VGAEIKGLLQAIYAGYDFFSCNYDIRENAMKNAKKLNYTIQGPTYFTNDETFNERSYYELAVTNTKMFESRRIRK
jgi:hypothetical protein